MSTEALKMIITNCKSINEGRNGLDKSIAMIQKIAEEALHPSESAGVPVDELWDEYSELIDDDIGSLNRWAGSTVIDKENFKKLINRLHSSGASAVWVKGQFDRLPVRQKVVAKMYHEHMNREVVGFASSSTGEMVTFDWGTGSVSLIIGHEELNNISWLDESTDAQGKEEVPVPVRIDTSSDVYFYDKSPTAKENEKVLVVDFDRFLFNNYKYAGNDRWEDCAGKSYTITELYDIYSKSK